MADREKVINGLKHCTRKIGYNTCEGCPYELGEFGCRELKRDALELLMGEHDDGWVSVKDRLPPMEKCVLVFCKGKSEHTQSVRTITEMTDINRFNYKCKTEPYWREPWDFFYANYDITHWMPLPEPPKEA